MIFPSSTEVDDLWVALKGLLSVELIGHCIKVSKRCDEGTHVICVYTRDAHDLLDVARVCHVLRERLGILTTLDYKSDADTRKGLYGPNSSLYTSPLIEDTGSTRRACIVRRAEGERPRLIVVQWNVREEPRRLDVLMTPIEYMSRFETRKVAEREGRR